MRQDRWIAVFGIFCLVAGIMTVLTGRIIFGGIMTLTGFAVFYLRGHGDFNQRSIYEKQIRCDISIGELYEKLKDMDTPLGRAWLAGVRSSKGECIVFGPGVFSDCIVIYRRGRNIVMRHTSQTGMIIRGEEDEYRFESVAEASGSEVSPARYSVFQSFKLTSVVMLGHLFEIVRDMASGRDVTVPGTLENYKFYYFNSSEGWFRDSEGNDVLRVEAALYPFRTAVYDADGNEMASVIPHSFDDKGNVVDKDGFELTANGEHYGEIRKYTDRTGGGFIAETGDGTFKAGIFPAVIRGKISCNYRIERDGRLMAVIAGSPKLIFEGIGTCRNEMIHSYDDDYLVLYAMLEVFILTLNSRFLK